MRPRGEEAQRRLAGLVWESLRQPAPASGLALPGCLRKRAVGRSHSESNSQASDCEFSLRGGISNSPALPKTEGFLGGETFSVEMGEIQANRDPLILSLLGGMARGKVVERQGGVC